MAAGIQPIHDVQPVKVAILGCGAMGSIYAAGLAAGGNEVWVIDVWREHIEAIQKDGLLVEGPNDERRVHVHAATDASQVGLSDLVVIATKASGVGSAAEIAAKLVKPEGTILTIQNGLGAGKRIAQHIDAGKVMLGIAGNFGAAMKSPGHAWHASAGLICLGEMNGGDSPQLERLVGIWTSAGFNVKSSPDINTLIWEKLIINCTVSGPCTLTGMTVGELRDNSGAWDVALACAREADAVARASGIPLSFEDVEAYVTNFVKSVRAAKPSLLQDHAAGRISEVDAIHGAVASEASRLGLDAPVNTTIVNLIRARESLF